MKIQAINAISFRNNYTNDDLYRLEQKLDGLQASLNGSDLQSFYRELPKERRLPMPIGVPPYAMNGMMGIGVGPNGMGMGPGMMPPPMGGMMPPRGGMYGNPMWNAGMMPPPPPTGAIYSPTTPPPMGAPMGMPPAGSPTSRLAGQPPYDMYCPRRGA